MSTRNSDPPPRSAYLDALSRRVLVYDGAMGTNIQRYHLDAPRTSAARRSRGATTTSCSPGPTSSSEIHESFLAVGCDVVETCTFQSTPRRLEEWGLDRQGARASTSRRRAWRARACDKYSTPDRPRFVAGSIGPTGLLPLEQRSGPVEHHLRRARGRTTTSRRSTWSKAASTSCSSRPSQDILEVKAALAGFERLFAELGRRVPMQAQVTLDTSGRMLLGTDIASAMTTLESLRVDVIGLNCSTGPEHMREPIRFLAEHATRPVSCIPNAGLPLNTGTGDAVYPLEPEPMATMLAEFVREFGVRIVGGCCGTTPEHLKAIVPGDRRARREVRGRASSARPHHDTSHDPRVTQARRRRGSQTRVPRALERHARDHHAPGSAAAAGRRARQLAGIAQGEAAAARRRLRRHPRRRARAGRQSGAHVLDVCVALTERADEAEQMAKVVKLLSMSVEPPLMIDSTEAAVIEARARARSPAARSSTPSTWRTVASASTRVVPLAKKHGAALVALTIDEVGMAKTRERKLEVARDDPRHRRRTNTASRRAT